MSRSRWYVDGILPSYGSINILGGNTHAGKSTLLYSLVRSLRFGSPFLGRYVTQPEHTAVILADRPLDDNPMWKRALDDELIDGFVCAITDHDYIETTELLSKDGKRMKGWERFDKLVKKLEVQEDMVLIIDVFTTGFLGNPMNIEEVKYNMDILNGRCAAANITLVGTGYGVKTLADKRQRYERYIDRLIGASTLRGGASSVMYLATTEESRGDDYDCQVFEAVPRNGPPIRLGLKLDEQRVFNVVPLQKREADPVEPTALACYTVLTTIPIIATRSKEIYEKYLEEAEEPVSASRFRDYLSQLVRHGEVECTERGVYRRVNPLSRN